MSGRGEVRPQAGKTLLCSDSNDEEVEACDSEYTWDTFQVDDDTEERENVLNERPQASGVVRIEIRGGCLAEVSGLPDGYVYVLIDHDSEG